MELEVAMIAVVVAVAALWLVLGVRTRAQRLPAEIAAVRRELEQTQHELEETRREIAELKAAAEVVPVPPLPRARSGGLDDLREQLRAAHREAEPESTADS
jgi:hypothetical protein